MTRRLAAGFLTGVSIVAGFYCLLLLFFLSTGFWTVLHETASQTYGNIPFGEIFGLALGQMLLTLPRYFWSGRWAMLALGCFGIILALVDALHRRIRRPWRNRLGFVVTAGAMVTVSVAFQYANRGNSYAPQTAQAALTDSRLLALSDAELIGLWSVVGVMLALPIWFAWSWWYLRWSAWLKVPGRQVDGPTPIGDDYRWREHQERMAWLKTGTWNDVPELSRAPARVPMAKLHWPWLLAGLIAASLLLVLATRMNTRFGPHVSVGQLRLRPEAPSAAAPVWLGPEPRWIKLSHAYGAGVIRVSLRSDHGALLPAPVELQLLSSAQGGAELPLKGQPPGNYRLEARLRDGRGGLVNYTALAESGVSAQLSAAAVGLAAGIWVGMAIVLAFELVIAMNSTGETMQDEQAG